MSKVISTVQLFSLRIDRRGNIQMSANRGFFEVLRSKLGAQRGATLRIGSFDFCEVRKSQFMAVPDERNAAAAVEAALLTTRILAIYRSILLFEKVFATPDSYEKFVMFNHRAPSFKDMQDMAKKHNIYVPFMEMPFKANLMDTPAALATVITEAEPVKKLFLVRKPSTDAAPIVEKMAVPKASRILLSVKRSASTQQLNALAQRFAR